MTLISDETRQYESPFTLEEVIHYSEMYHKLLEKNKEKCRKNYKPTGKPIGRPRKPIEPKKIEEPGV